MDERTSDMLAGETIREAAEMGRKTVALGVAVLLAAGHCAGAAGGNLMNYSFEDDGPIHDLRVSDPNGWDVNLPAGMFRGNVYSDWATEGHYCLTLGSDWFVTFTGGETATASQEIALTGTGEIVFDLRLNTVGGYGPWDPNVCAAVVLIDDDVVWQSGFPKADIRGVYLDQVVPVDGVYRDGQPHRLSLGLKVLSGGMLFEKYSSQWDAVECVSICGGGGLLPGDFNGDCFVNTEDLAVLAADWLHGDEASPGRCNLMDNDEDFIGKTNGGDFAVLAGHWLGSSLAGQEQMVAP